MHYLNITDLAIKIEDVNPDSLDLSRRERNELMTAFDLKDKLI